MASIEGPFSIARSSRDFNDDAYCDQRKHEAILSVGSLIHNPLVQGIAAGGVIAVLTTSTSGPWSRAK